MPGGTGHVQENYNDPEDIVEVVEAELRHDARVRAKYGEEIIEEEDVDSSVSTDDEHGSMITCDENDSNSHLVSMRRICN